MEFFSSDTHAFHTNIIKYCERPFENSWEMTKHMADEINAVVMPNDIYYHLGDWSFGGPQQAIRFREMIDCKKVILIYGNHDSRNRRKEEFNKLFEKTADLLHVKIQRSKTELFLCHYAMLSWNKSHWGIGHLYGHSHGNLPHPNPMAFDVGVDCWDFKPLSIDQVVKVFEERKASE